MNQMNVVQYKELQGGLAPTRTNFSEQTLKVLPVDQTSLVHPLPQVRQPILDAIEDQLKRIAQLPVHCTLTIAVHVSGIDVSGQIWITEKGICFNRFELMDSIGTLNDLLNALQPLSRLKCISDEATVFKLAVGSQALVYEIEPRVLIAWMNK